MIVSRELPADGNMSFGIYSAPSIEPVSVEELKLFARIDGEDEDSMLAAIIVAVRMATEEYLKRSLITQTVRAAIDFWPDSGKLELPKPPLQSVVQIAERSEENVLTVYAAANYYVVTESIPGIVCIKRGVEPPTNEERDYAGIIIDYICGYGDNAEDVPDAIRQAMLLWATAAYESRVTGSEPPPSAKPLLDIFRVERLD